MLLPACACWNKSCGFQLDKMNVFAPSQFKVFQAANGQNICAAWDAVVRPLVDAGRSLSHLCNIRHFVRSARGVLNNAVREANKSDPDNIYTYIEDKYNKAQKQVDAACEGQRKCGRGGTLTEDQIASLPTYAELVARCACDCCAMQRLRSALECLTPLAAKHAVNKFTIACTAKCCELVACF